MAYGIQWRAGARVSEIIAKAKDRAGRFTDGRDLEYLYRFEDASYSTVVDAELDLYSSTGPILELHAYLVMKKTPKGWKINGPHGDQFVGEEHKKQFASPTLKDAITHYVARKARQCKIYSARLKDAEEAHRQGVDALTEIIDRGL